MNDRTGGERLLRTEHDQEGGLPDLAARREPTVYTFTLPKSVRVGKHDPTTVTLRELDDDLLRTARKVGRDDQGAATEAVKLSLWKVDGRPVNHSEDEATFLWSRWSSKVKHQIQLGWAKVHTTDAREDESFLSSMTVG